MQPDECVSERAETTCESLIKAKPGTNIVASETLLRLPLCKLASIAQGEAKVELMTALGYKNDDSLSTCFMVKDSINEMTISDLTHTNRIFVNYIKEIDPNFIINSTENFGIKVDKVGFNYPKAAVSYINNLIGTTTLRRITDVVDDSDINKETEMIIVTAAHFKGTWEFPFDFRLTKLRDFHPTEGKIIRIPMMTKTDMFRYIENKDCQAVSIRFGSSRASFTIILPNSPQQLPALLDNIYNQKAYVYSLVTRMRNQPLKVTFPRFKVKSFIDLTESVKKLGLNTIFNTTSSGLEGILRNSNKSIALNKIKQKLFVQIDEVGVARFIHFENMGPPQVQESYFENSPQFTADRPFYFDISLDFDNARYEMFTGVYYGPEETTTANEIQIKASK
ncbi:hypothetical protein HW555_006335 [Spodoptera exigua]|uniref:Serpin domain-containing protein n=1 Tax=Spodoptera exigua TaxID=7107 RepID=A0A835GF89_SPOEX|nr:hypothetical protein HW555_006335 [Spodoptera exigua]